MHHWETPMNWVSHWFFAEWEIRRAILVEVVLSGNKMLREETSTSKQDVKSKRLLQISLLSGNKMSG